MSLSLVTAHAGYSHVTSQQAAQRTIGITGARSYWAGDKPELSMSPTSVTVAPFMLVVDGRYMSNDAKQTIDFKPGVQGYSRHDILAIRYHVVDGEEGSTESIEFVVVAGTSTGYDGVTDEAVDPDVTQTDLSLLPKVSVIPIARITLLNTSVSAEHLINDSSVSIQDIVDYMTIPPGRQKEQFTTQAMNQNQVDDVLFVSDDTAQTMRKASAAGFNGVIHSMAMTHCMNTTNTRGHFMIRVHVDPTNDYDLRDHDGDAFLVKTGVTMTIPDGWESWKWYKLCGYAIINSNKENCYATTSWVFDCGLMVDEDGGVWGYLPVLRSVTSFLAVVEGTISTMTLREVAAQ